MSVLSDQHWSINREGIMPTFEVRIKEKCIRHAVEEVEADDWEAAEEIVREMYYNDQLDFEYTSDDLDIEAEELTLWKHSPKIN